MAIETINAELIFPRSKELDGDFLTDSAIIAARRCRSTKSYQELVEEVNKYSQKKKENFLNTIVHEEWALDILEMLYIQYDVTNIPIWLIIEFLRHRLIWRDFSMEQLSQRAIKSNQLTVDVPKEFRELVEYYLEATQKIIDKNPHIRPEDYRAVFPQGVEVSFVVAGNLRAFQHFFFMRNSLDNEGAGGAQPDRAGP